MKVTHETVAAEVRASLARNRRSGRSVALQLGWNQNYIWRRLTGDTPFSIEDLAAIAEVLDVPVATFFGSPEGLNRLGWRTLAVAA